MSGSRSARAPAPVVITALGAVTSVGHSAPASCAAIRAGITRPRRVWHFEALDSETMETVGLTAHPIHGFTEGFLGMGRWLRLARACVGELLRTPGLPPASDRAFWSRTGLAVATPAPDDELFEPEGEDGLAGVREAYVHPLRDELGLAIRDEAVEVLGLGQAGVAAAVEHGLEVLSRGSLERLLVVAADSLLDPAALALLGEEGRLKTGDSAVGLMAGEAGACFLLERRNVALQRGATPLAGVSGVVLAEEENHFFSDAPNQGLGLADCIREVLARTSPQTPFEGDIYSDLNGESWRSQEWGMARVRLRDVLGEVLNLHLPCTSVGDVGAASGALGVCLAVHDLSLGHARTGHALGLSSSHWGDVGCISLHVEGD